MSFKCWPEQSERRAVKTAVLKCCILREDGNTFVHNATDTERESTLLLCGRTNRTKINLFAQRTGYAERSGRCNPTIITVHIAVYYLVVFDTNPVQEGLIATIPEASVLDEGHLGLLYTFRRRDESREVILLLTELRGGVHKGVDMGCALVTFEVGFVVEE